MGDTTYTRILPELKSFLIKVYSYENKSIQGTVYHPFCSQDQAFENLTQLITLICKILDELKGTGAELRLLNNPQKPDENRVLLNSGERGARGKVIKLPIAVFKITIIFQRNASWQGELTWTNKGIKNNFRSALELIMLLDSALEPENSEKQIDFLLSPKEEIL